VTQEASPATTVFEMFVGDELCKMVNYPLPPEEEVLNGAIRA
jgi:ATP:corrinoid adenosyltransferase